MSSEFEKAILEAGIICKDPIVGDGILYRFANKGSGDKDCWYIFYGSAGAFGDWSQGINEKWSMKQDHLSDWERKQVREQRSKAKKAADEEIARRHQEVAIHTKGLWERLKQSGSSHYLDRKQVPPYGIRYGKEAIAIPLHDIEGKIWSLQTIDHDGNKRFLKGGRKKGCFFSMGTLQNSEMFYICEGYSTGASIHQATGMPVIVAFDASNLEPVVLAIRTKWPNKSITICADNDQWKDKNVGLESAQTVAIKHNCKILYPIFEQVKIRSEKPTDFNDLHCLGGIDMLKEQLEGGKSEEIWPDPQSIKEELLPIKSLPPEIIPLPLREYCVDIAHRMQCPIDYVVIGLLTMISSVIGSGCAIRPKQRDNWQIIPNLWGMIVGNPSVLKSPALNEVLKSLARLESQAYEKYQAEYKNYLSDIELNKIKKSGIMSGIKKSVKSGAGQQNDLEKQLHELTEKEEPCEKRFRTNNATIEKMGELLAKNPRGLLLFHDELAGLLASWSKEGHETDRAFYLQAWNGSDHYSTDRIGRGTIRIGNVCISILGGIQPTVLRKYLDRTLNTLGNDGLFQRFQLLVYPDPVKDWQLIDQRPKKEAADQVFQIVEFISTMDFVANGANQDASETIPYFRFTDDAQQIFYEWLEDLERKLSQDDDESLIIEHLAKYRKLMPALSLIFHLVGIASGNVSKLIECDTIKKAAAWCDYLESHMRRIYGLVLGGNSHLAKILATKIKKQLLQTPFSLRDVYRKGWSSLRTRDEAEMACEELMRLGWLREVDGGYSINPKIWEKK